MNRFLHGPANTLVAAAQSLGRWIERHVVDEQPWDWDPIWGDVSPGARVLWTELHAMTHAIRVRKELTPERA